MVRLKTQKGEKKMVIYLVERIEGSYICTPLTKEITLKGLKEETFIVGI